MRALVCEAMGGEDHLAIHDDWPSKPCGPKGVRIAVQAASVNFPDTLVTRGLYQVKQDPPFVPGNEVSGIVTEVGVAYGASAVVDPAGNEALFARLFDWYARGLVRPRIGHRFPLERGADAVRVVRDRQALGKVVIEIASPTNPQG